MKVKLVCFVLLNLFPSLIFSQKNGFRINVKSLLNYKKDIIVENDSVNFINIPQSDNGINYNELSITYLRSVKNLTLFIGFGLNWGGSTYENSGDSNNHFREQKSVRKEKGAQIHLGIIKEVPIKETKLSFNIGIGILGEYTYQKDNFSAFHLSDLNRNHESGNELQVHFGNVYSFGPNFEIGIYYELLKNFSLGINHNFWFYWELENGSDHYQYTVFGPQKTITGKSNFSHIVNKNIFGKSNFFSFSFLYKF